MRESVQRMSGKKLYKGEKYSFYRISKSIGRGGNGAVYDVELCDGSELDYPVVAKFFEFAGEDKEKRYKRFLNEIDALNKLQDIGGVMTILDYCYTPEVPTTKDGAWYLMPKANPYRPVRSTNIYGTLNCMLELAKTIQLIHAMGGAHRDIKPENILVLNDRMVLSDFGMYWEMEEERFTELNERIGPYKIMPPEFEAVQIGLDLDFRPSDVYLFAKVLWMALKGDNVGFRGKYSRRDAQIYLDKTNYDHVITMEPIHMMLEQATCDDMSKRISIGKCIEYIETQLNIIKADEKVLFSDKHIKRLIYDENSKAIADREEPDEVIYRDINTISSMLNGVLPVAKVLVESAHEGIKDNVIQVSDFDIDAERICRLLYYDKGIKQIEYLFKINKMIFSQNNAKITLALGNPTPAEGGYITYADTIYDSAGKYKNVLLTETERITIEHIG